MSEVEKAGGKVLGSNCSLPLTDRGSSETPLANFHKGFQPDIQSTRAFLNVYEFDGTDRIVSLMPYLH